MSKQVETYRANYLKAVRALRVDREDLETDVAMADYLGISKMTFSKIKASEQLPTVDHAITLCKKGGFNANWMFLNTGEMYLSEQHSLNDIMAKISGKTSKVIPLKQKKG